MESRRNVKKYTSEVIISIYSGIYYRVLIYFRRNSINSRVTAPTSKLLSRCWRVRFLFRVSGFLISMVPLSVYWRYADMLRRTLRRVKIKGD